MSDSSAKPGAFVAPLNQFLERAVGKSLGLIHVIEYPKCGGSWVARILRSYLNMDRRYGTSHLVRKNAVLQRHELPAPYYHRVVTVFRDPRDVWVSYYFHEMYHHPDEALKKRIGFNPDEEDRTNLLRYVSEKMEHPEQSGPGFSYDAFKRAWATRSGRSSSTAYNCDG